MSAPPEPRAVRYQRRLDAALAALPTDLERRRFCDREFAKWEGLYADFASHPDNHPADATASDFLETICVISTRQIRYGGALLGVLS